MDNNFWKIKWGSDEAKGDMRLPEYFVQIPEFEDIIDGEYRYIIGRKGTGKTAICEQIKNEAEDNPLWFYKYLSLRDFPTALVRSLGDKYHRDKAKYVPIWKFLLLIELSMMIFEDQGVSDDDTKNDIRDFLKINFPEDCSFTGVLKTLDKNNSKLSIKKGWFGGELGNESSVESTSHVHYQKISSVLVKKIKNIISKSKYFIIIDELDEGYKSSDHSLRLILLALLRAVEDTALELNSSNISYRPILALRSDIFDSLEDNDLNKLDDHVVRLRWYSKESELYSLYDIVNARIEASLHFGADIDGWSKVVYENDRKIPLKVKSIWKYMTNRTFERPRDIIKFLKYCRKIKNTGILQFDTVRDAELKYSDWLYRELRDEIHSHLPVWKESLNCLTRVGTGYIKNKKRIINEIEKDNKIFEFLSKNNKTPDDIISVLFDFGVLGNLNEEGTWLFKYKDDDLAYNPNMTQIVHFGFHRKLKLKVNGKKKSNE